MVRAISVAAVIMAFSVSACAQKNVWRLENEDGGGIFISDERCGTDQMKGLAWARLNNGKTITGCWTFEKATQMVIVRWGNGELYTYPSAEFTEIAPERQQGRARH